MHINNNLFSINGFWSTTNNIKSLLKYINEKNSLYNYETKIIIQDICKNITYKTKFNVANSDYNKYDENIFIIVGKTGKNINKFSRYNENEVLFIPNTFYNINLIINHNNINFILINEIDNNKYE